LERELGRNWEKLGEIMERRRGNGEIQQHDDKSASDEQSTVLS
jgi:hypothetical protein